MRKTKKRRRGSGTAGIMIIVLAFLVVMTVQICRIRSKDAEYAAKEKELQQQYEEETERSTEIDDLETYMKSSQYIEDVAKSKLGLTYKNEIICCHVIIGCCNLLEKSIILSIFTIFEICKCTTIIITK